MRTHTRILAMVVVLMLGAGCLQKETRHTLALSPDGELAWQVIEHDVVSDESDRLKQRTEEDEYLAAALAGMHPVARGLAALDPTSTRTRVVRRQRPFTVITDAVFASVDRMIDRVLAELRVPGYATLVHTGTVTTLTVHVDLGSVTDDQPTNPVTELIEELDRYRIVMTDGRFVAAAGFTLQHGGRVAVPVAVSAEEGAARGQVFDLMLSWDRSK